MKATRLISGWHSSGEKIDWLPENTYRIIFSDIAGWATPSPQTESIKSGTPVTTSGTYTDVPGAATLIGPSGAVNTAVPIYTWNAVSNATWYYLWVNENGGNVVKQWYTASDAGCGGDAGICSVMPSAALAAGSATWWVQTWTRNGYGPWSNSMGFTVPEGLPGKATLVSPSGTTINNWPAYTWNANAQSTWYFLWVNDSTGNKISTGIRRLRQAVPGGTGTCYRIVPALPLHRVQPSGGSRHGTRRLWPLERRHGIHGAGAGLSGKATLVSPSGTISTTTPIYTWNADANSTWYYLWVNDSTGNKISTGIRRRRQVVPAGPGRVPKRLTLPLQRVQPSGGFRPGMRTGTWVLGATAWDSLYRNRC